MRAGGRGGKAPEAGLIPFSKFKTHGTPWRGAADFDWFKNQKNSGKSRRRCEKMDSAARVGGRGGVPGEALESAKSARIDRVCKNVWDALSPASRGRRI